MVDLALCDHAFLRSLLPLLHVAASLDCGRLRRQEIVGDKDVFIDLGDQAEELAEERPAVFDGWDEARC